MSEYAGVPADATSWELEQLDEVMAELEAEGLDGDDGPWHDASPGLAGDWTADLAAAGAMVDAQGAREHQRIMDDVLGQLDRRPSVETRLSNALDRIGRHTYVPEGMRRWGSDTQLPGQCGPVDDMGQCSGRYHEHGCMTLDYGAAARSEPAAVEAWNRELRRSPPSPAA